MNTPQLARLIDAPEGGGLQRIMWYCPGCLCSHGVPIPPDPRAWRWNGSLEKPALSPSVLIDLGHGTDRPSRCHSFLSGGQIEYCADSTHHLAGRTVPMRPEPTEDDQFPG